MPARLQTEYIHIMNDFSFMQNHYLIINFSYVIQIVTCNQYHEFFK